MPISTLKLNIKRFVFILILLNSYVLTWLIRKRQGDCLCHRELCCSEAQSQCTGHLPEV